MAQATLSHPALDEARALAQRDSAGGWAALDQLFRSGSAPAPPLAGPCAGSLLARQLAPGLTQLARAITSAWLPWQGKTFDPARSAGANIFTRDSLALEHVFWPLYRDYADDGPRTYRAFAFHTYIAPGLFDSDRRVLKIDYDLPANPGLSIRRVLDELVQIGEGEYLGKAHLKWWWGRWQTVAFFGLRPAAPR